MADSAGSFSSRSQGARPAKGRARAASTGDEHSSARVAVESQPRQQVLRDDAGEAGEASEDTPSLHFDPRQGTLLGFELPAEAFVSMTAGGQHAGGEPVGATEGASLPRSRASAEETLPTAQLPIASETPVTRDRPPVARRAGGPAKSVAAQRNTSAAPQAEKGAGGAPDTVAAESAATPSKAATPELDQRAEASEAKPDVGAGSPDGASPASPASPRVPLLSPGAALASVRQQSTRRPADPMRAAGKGAAAQAGPTPPSAGDAGRSAPAAPMLPLSPAEQPAVAGSAADETALPYESPEANPLSQTVASLQAALDQAQHAAQDRWRRTRRWLALTAAGLALLLIVCLAQTVALIGFVHRSEAAQQQAQSVLSQQQAALAGLASAVSALSATGQGAQRAASPADGATPANTAQQPAKRAAGAHARRAADRSKSAAH